MQPGLPAPSRRRAGQLQLQQLQRQQLHAQQLTQREELLLHSSPPRDKDDAEDGRASSPQKPRSGNIASQLWAETSQLQPCTPSPAAAEPKLPISLADLKAEMASSTSKRM